MLQGFLKSSLQSLTTTTHARTRTHAHTHTHTHTHAHTHPHTHTHTRAHVKRTSVSRAMRFLICSRGGCLRSLSRTLGRRLYSALSRCLRLLKKLENVDADPLDPVDAVFCSPPPTPSILVISMSPPPPPSPPLCADPAVGPGDAGGGYEGAGATSIPPISLKSKHVCASTHTASL